jgi:hypothetical protein
MYQLGTHQVRYPLLYPLFVIADLLSSSIQIPPFSQLNLELKRKEMTRIYCPRTHTHKHTNKELRIRIKNVGQ